MPKKKKPQPFNTEKDVVEGRAVKDAPIVGGEFVTEDGNWQGQTVEVKSDTHLEDDHGTGDPVIIRTFQFAANPLAFQQTPTQQDIFDSHKKGIEALLWQDGLSPAQDIPPRFIVSKGKDKYAIIIAARPSLGQTLIEKTQTLSEIINAGKGHSDVLSGKL